MKKYNVLLHRAISALICCFSICRAEATDKKMGTSVRDLWKEVIVDDTRNYNQSISVAQAIIKEKFGNSEALTAELLLCESGLK